MILGENEILKFINKGRRERGEEEAFGLTNAVLQQELKKINPFWTNTTNKDKEAMLRDFRHTLHCFSDIIFNLIKKNY